MLLALRKIRFFALLFLFLLLTFATVLVFRSDSAGIAEDRPTASPGEKSADEDWFRPETDPRELRVELNDQQVSDRWIYHDLDSAREESRRTGKPMLVLFRCVPCGSAPGLDGAVCTAGGAEASQFEAQIQAAGGDLAQLLDQFVTVRMVKMNGVNRNVFQFDRDVPYVAMFLNADGTVYGRYGTRYSNDRKNLHRQNLSSFQKSVRRALQIHRAQPKYQESLTAKRGPVKTPAMPADMPEFEPFPEKYNPVVKNCIHCHTVGEAELRERLAEGPLELRDVWPYPRPENLGLEIDVQDGLKIASVTAGSPAAKAGIQRDDVLLWLDGQLLISEADVQWALHHAPDEGTIPVVVRRAERTVKSEIMLQNEWRKSRVRWRATVNVLRPDVLFDPQPQGLQAYYPTGKAAQAGIRSGDLIVAVDGKKLHMEADFLKYIHMDRPELKTVELTVVRKGQELTITLPIR